MKIKSISSIIILLAICMMVCSCAVAEKDMSKTDKLSWLSQKKHLIVDDKGETVILKGCNFGSWLNFEMWMMDIKDKSIEDQYTLENIFQERFGKAQREAIMETFRASWITERDFQMAKSFGFNCVRVPFHYNLIEDDDKPMQVRDGAWKWLDFAVEMGRKYDLYIVLDLHSVAGSQNNFDHSGRINYNKYWTDKTYWERTKWLWQEIAKRYKDCSTIAAYQPLNEPWGGELKEQHEAFDYLYKAIREIDKEHLIISSAHFTGFDHFGNPKDHGWKGVGFSQNFYPGLFGGGAARPEGHAWHFNWVKDELAPKLKKLETPFLITEFNVVFDKAGGADMMRRHYDAYAGQGWAATMWSYKLVTSPGKKNTGGWWLVTNPGDMITGGWWLVTNKEQKTQMDYRKASLEEIKAYFKSFGTMEYLVREDLKKVLTSKEKLPPIKESAALVPIVEAPANDEFKGWTATDVSGPKIAGGQKVHSDSALDIYGGGADAWAYFDQFRYIWKKAKGDFEVTATIDSFTFTNMYAKAGLMVRKDLDPNSSVATVDTIPDASVEFLWRSSKGAHMEAKMVMGTQYPGIRLKVVRKGNKIARYFASEKGPWDKFDEVEFGDLQGEVYVGLFCLSHVDDQLAKAVFRDVSFKELD